MVLCIQLKVLYCVNVVRRTPRFYHFTCFHASVYIVMLMRAIFYNVLAKVILQYSTYVDYVDSSRPPMGWDKHKFIEPLRTSSW
jgi:hypothetical protein